MCEEYKAWLANIDTLKSELESFRDVSKDSWGLFLAKTS